MRTVHVCASRCYDVIIGSGLLQKLGSHTRTFDNVRKICIVSDSTVWMLYGNIAEESLVQAGFDICRYVFPAGEESKNGNTYISLLNYLAEHRLTRTDLIVALGGGVVGDLAGFAAATYLRGIRFFQVPTTLLAAVDSSVGGKTAIDLPAGKNLAGAFWQPSLVLCDTDTLNTLPEDVFRDGCTEVIKYGVLYDPALFDTLYHDGPGFDRETVISRCVELKRDVVAADEFDTGARMKLNLGHTVGHAIEQCSNYQISHGRAVAAGMAIVARASRCRDAAAIIGCLDRFGLPTSTHYPAEDLVAVMTADKKRAGDTVNLIIPRCVGCCDIVPTPIEHLKSILEEGL